MIWWCIDNRLSKQCRQPNCDMRRSTNVGLWHKRSWSFKKKSTTVAWSRTTYSTNARHQQAPAKDCLSRAIDGFALMVDGAAPLDDRSLAPCTIHQVGWCSQFIIHEVRWASDVVKHSVIVTAVRSQGRKMLAKYCEHMLSFKSGYQYQYRGFQQMTIAISCLFSRVPDSRYSNQSLMFYAS